MRDLAALLPSFREMVTAIVLELEQLGYAPGVRGTTRTQAQADANAKTGAGIKDSLHKYGIAVDFHCRRHGFECAEHGCKFFDVLGPVAEKHGGTWGGRWKRGKRGPDKPHVQAIPVRFQGAFRKLTTPETRDAFVRLVLEQRRRSMPVA